MTVASLVLLLFILYEAGCKKDYNLKIADHVVMLIFFELFANSGKILSISNIELQYSDVLWIVLLLYLFKSRSIRFQSRNQFIDISIFFAILILNLILEMCFPYNESFNMRSIFIFVRLILMILATNLLYTEFSRVEHIYIYNKIVKLQRMVYVIVTLEFLLKISGNTELYFRAIQIILGNSENQVNWLIERGGMYAIQGLCKEPSHFAIMIFFVNMYNLWAISKQKQNSLYFWINCLLLLVSGSFSSVLYLFVLFIGYLLFVKGTKKIGLCMATLILLVILVIVGTKYNIINYYFGRLENSISIMKYRIQDLSSESMRINSIFNSFDSFKTRPFMGIGLGNNVATGAFPAFLSVLGVVGIISYFKIVLKNKYLYIPVFLVVIASFFAMDMGMYYSSYFMFFILLYRDKNV